MSAVQTSFASTTPQARPAAQPADWWLASWDNLAEAQSFWMSTLLPWNQGLLATQRNLWDEWTCRWAGGAPIDG